MDISLLIHEGTRRGIVFGIGPSGLEILDSPGEADDGFRSLISDHKAEIAAHLALRSSGFSPHDSGFSPQKPRFSPLSPENLDGGLNITRSFISNSIQFSPLSPLEKGEELRERAKQNCELPEREGGRNCVRVYSEPPLLDSGLSGLSCRNVLNGSGFPSSPCPQKSGLSGGLNGLDGGLNLSQVNCEPLLPHSPPTWEQLSSLRWGPAMDEDRPWVVAEADEPGIVIDTPDRERMLAALRSRRNGGHGR